MREVGHTQRREARPYAPVRQIEARMVMVARATAVALILVGFLVGVLNAFLWATAFDGLSLLCVLAIAAGLWLGIRFEDIPKDHRPINERSTL